MASQPYTDSKRKQGTETSNIDFNPYEKWVEHWKQN